MTKQPPADKPIPFDREAERSVVASLMVDPDAMDRIDSFVSSEDFFDQACRPAFEACRALWRRDEEINQVTVAHQLGEVLNTIGGLQFLAQLTSDLPTPIGVEHYAQIVRKDAKYRAMIKAGSQIVSRGYDAGADLDAAIIDCDRLVSGLREESPDVVPITKLVDEYMETAGVNSRDTRFARTGITELDDFLHGLKPGTLTVVAAETRIGKSVLLLNIARNAVVGQNFRVVVLSLEMGRYEWRERMIANETGIAIDRLAGGFEQLNEDEQRRVVEARVLLDGAALYIDDRAQISVESMRATLRNLRTKLDGIDLVVVDYLQLMGNHRRFESRHLEVGAISRGLKLLAKELDVPILAAAQLSREVDKRSIQRRKQPKNGNGMQADMGLTLPGLPRLSDLRESGSIEQDADIVILMYRQDKHVSRKEWENYYGVSTEHQYPLGMIRLIVAKNRNGRTGHCYARMSDQYARIEDIAPVVQEAAPWAR